MLSKKEKHPIKSLSDFFRRLDNQLSVDFLQKQGKAKQKVNHLNQS